ncbi:MAG: 3-methyl-2-oxobutanoate dehydrogenase subunit beta, partial [Clostridia bacterium]|nr:3-methyl-2-oxobutanoate dehydrogenase subunit beta [Clostridia bacterium]
PITVSPYPDKALSALADKACVKKFLVAELSKGQMVEDVRLIVNGKKPVEFYGRTGGHVINTEELIEVIEGGKR